MLTTKNWKLIEPASRSDYRVPTRLQIGLWAALVLATVMVSLWDYDSFQVGVYEDDAVYVIMARSLLQGNFDAIHAPANLAASALYPIGYPLLLTPFAALFPHNLDALKALSLLATLLSEAVLFWGWSWLSHRSCNWSLAVIALYGFCPVTVEHTRMVMSEAVFTAFTLVAIVLAEKMVREEHLHWAQFGLLALLLLFVPLIRTVGILLLPGVWLYLWLKGNRRLRRMLLTGLGLLLGLGGVAFVAFPSRMLFPTRYLRESNAALLVALYSVVAPNRSVDILPEWYVTETASGERQVDVQGLLREFWSYRLPQHLFRDLRELVFPLGGGKKEEALGARLGLPALSTIVGAGIFSLIVMGYLRWVRREGITLLGGFAVVYFAALMLWNWIGPRLLYPIQPQLYLALLEGIALIVVEGLAFFQQRKAGRIIFAGIAAVLIVLSFYRSLHLKDSRAHTGDLQTRTAWIVQHLPPDAVIMSEESERDFIYSERQTVPQPRLAQTLVVQATPSGIDDSSAETEEPDVSVDAISSTADLYAYLVQYRVDYILIAPHVEWQAQYTPTYTDDTQRMWYLLSQMLSEERVALVYASEPDFIYVFRFYR